MQVIHNLSSVLVATAVIACGSEPADLPVEPGAITVQQAAAWSPWSEPVKLGPVINVPMVTDGNAVLAPDGLSLYYDSDRTDLSGAQGARDIWVSRRACTDWLDPACEWQTPVNVGPQINTPHVDGLPVISDDGHLLFFLSHTTRPDCPADPDAPDPTRPCDADVFLSWREDPTDDLGWGPAVALPAPVNTGEQDNVGAFVTVGEPGRGNLYFDRMPDGFFDVFYVPIRVTARGADIGPGVQVLGDVMPLSEINAPSRFDAQVSIRKDGRELFFGSNRVGGLGGLDVWTSTRRSPHDPWSPPTNVTELNSIRLDNAPKLSRDGGTLIFTSNREMAGNGPCLAAGLPPSCGWDIYVSTRTRQP